MNQKYFQFFLFEITLMIFFIGCANTIPVQASLPRTSTAPDITAAELSAQLILIASLPDVSISREKIESIFDVKMIAGLDHPYSMYEHLPENWLIVEMPRRPYTISFRKGQEFTGFGFGLSTQARLENTNAVRSELCISAAKFSTSIQ